MPKKHKVKQGECISSIAELYGFFPDTLWDDPANAELKEKRKNPNTLLQGDVVVIPDKQLGNESAATEEQHRFRKKGVPAKLVLYLRCGSKPRSNETYKLNIDGSWTEGTTTEEGKIEIAIPPGAETGELYIGELQEKYPLLFGYIDPVSEISGAQSRLRNMGLYDGVVNGVLDERTEKAIRLFQRTYEIPESGELDETTQSELKEVYGC